MECSQCRLSAVALIRIRELRKAIDRSFETEFPIGTNGTRIVPP
jgi:hypothetical protein